MRCPNCNDVLPIGAKVCKKCNYNLYTQKFESTQPKPVQPSVPPQPTVQQQSKIQTPKRPKKAGRVIITVLAVLLATGVGRFLGSLAGRAAAENWEKDLESGYSYQEEIEETINPAFDAFLMVRGLTYTPAITTLNCECFATDLGDGTLEILELRYFGDAVKEMIDTFYYPISDLSEDDLAIGETNLRETFDAMIDNAYITVSYDRIDGQYFVVQLHFKATDTQSVIQSMTDMGMLQKDPATGKYVDYISVNKSTEALLANGFIQR